VQAIEADGGLDVLVNNAGIQEEMGDSNVVIGAADVTAFSRPGRGHPHRWT
jgi:hypothetical protein